MGKPQYIGSRSHIHHSEQELQNQSWDALFDVSVTESLEYIPAGATDPATLIRPLSSNVAIRLDDVTTANVTYVGKARAGEGTDGAVWQVQKVHDSSAGLIITWADGDTNFDNVWDDRAALTYA